MEKKRKKLERYFAHAVGTLLLVLVISMVGGQLLYERAGINIGKTKRSVASRNVKIAWDELYPFTPEQLAQIAEENAEPFWEEELGPVGQMFADFSETMQEYATLGETWETHMYKYSDITNAGLGIGFLVTEPSIESEYTRFTNGYWGRTRQQVSNNYTQREVDAVVDFKEYLSERDIPLMWVQPAFKNCKIDPQLPYGEVDYTNDNIDNFLGRLETAEVPFVDLREALHRDFDDHYSLFYKTDHHWTIPAGFWANDVIEDSIEEQLGIVFDQTYNDASQYEERVFENAMFGPEGQSVTHYIESSEDFSILFPNFKTDFHLSIPDKDIDVEGAFEDVFVDFGTLANEINKGGGYVYETVLYGNRPLVEIQNKNNPDGPKVLMIRDSYSIALAPYMALGCSELDLIDIRPSNGNFFGSIRSYIEQTSPDVVLVMLSFPEIAYR